MTKNIRPGQPGPAAGTVTRYRDRIYDDKRHDPYEASGKYAEPTHCGTCGALFHRGRWQWGAAQPASHATTCPACRRIADALPAGEIVLEGPFVAGHRDELLGLVRHEGERERTEHPMHRVIATTAEGERIVVTTTDVHLPRRIGEALERAWDGKLDLRFGHDEYSVRAVWRR